MILFSDLDATVIYSKKRIRDYDNACCVEKLENREISYMKDVSLSYLKNLSMKDMFIPTTTRSIELYKRIQGFHPMKIKHAITSNGGNVLENDKIDRSYELIIKDKLSHECMDKNDIISIFSNIKSKTWTDELKLADDLFYYSIVNKDNIPYDELEYFTKEIDNYKWDCILNGRKMYMLPKCINKWDAVRYVKNKLECSEIICAGDSVMDLEMLENADYAIVPCHGSVVEYIKKGENLHITKASGIDAGVEILKKALELSNKTYAYGESD